MKTLKNALLAAFTLPLCLIFPVSRAAEDQVVVPGGTEIPLELLHHLNSSYSPPGSDVYLAVAEDLILDGRTVIPRGHVVRGVVSEAEESKSMGRAGFLEFHVDSLVAPDGTEIPIDADFGSYGRDRGKATGHLTAAFGFAGLFAKGRMAYLEKGTDFTAVVSEEREVGPPTWSEASRKILPSGRESEASLRDGSITLAIEKGRKLRPIEIRIESPIAQALTPEELDGFALVGVDGLRLPQPVACLAGEDASRDSDDDGLPEHRLRCEAWDVLKYCAEGRSNLVFAGQLADGSVTSARVDLDVNIRKK